MSGKISALKKSITKTAEKASASVARKAKRLTGVPPHRHCRICHAAIDLKSDPPICHSSDCSKSWEKDQRDQKKLKFWMTTFIALFAFAFIGPLLLQLIG